MKKHSPDKKSRNRGGRCESHPADEVPLPEVKPADAAAGGVVPCPRIVASAALKALHHQLEEKQGPVKRASREQQLLLGAKTVQDLPNVLLLHSPGLADALSTVLLLARQTVDATCYCLDREMICSSLATLLRRGVSIRMLMDKKQMQNPSCARRLAALAELTQGLGNEFLQIRVLQPKTAGFSSLHAKTWCVDGEVYLGGSFNPTRNAEDTNEDKIVLINGGANVAVHKAWYADVWKRGTPTGPETISEGAVARNRVRSTKGAQVGAVSSRPSGAASTGCSVQCGS